MLSVTGLIISSASLRSSANPVSMEEGEGGGERMEGCVRRRGAGWMDSWMEEREMKAWTRDVN